jgi:molybdenum cofactor synthesis domain-containing protein
MTGEITAGVILIGNEILSGRTRDGNLHWLGQQLSDLGIRLREARVVEDETPAIVEAVHALRARNHYVFTTGGIGPTHDDITTAAVAEAFGRPLIEHPEARQRLLDFYGAEQLTAPRLKMAVVPEGAELIDNPVSAAPGFRIDNVFVLAGVTSIMQAMFRGLAHSLEHGAPILARSIEAPLGESRIAEGLDAIQQRHADVAIGCYPRGQAGKPSVCVVLRGRDPGRLSVVAEEVAALMTARGAPAASIQHGEPLTHDSAERPEGAAI